MNAEETSIMKILGAAETDFAGRAAELEKIVGHCSGDSGALLVLSKPANGLTELLRQAFDRLFRRQSETIPVYFSFKHGETPYRAAVRFVQTLLAQTVSFRRADPRILEGAPTTTEILRLAPAADAAWLDALAANTGETNKGDERAFVRSAFGAPLRAQLAGARLAVLFDDLQFAETAPGETNLLEEIREIYESAPVPFVFAGRRRFLLDALRKGQNRMREAEILNLESLSIIDAGLLTERLAAARGVKINEQTRDLIVRQFSSSPLFVSAIIAGARERKMNLDSFQRVEQIYVEELFGGRIEKYFETMLDAAAPQIKTRRTLLRLLNDAFGGERRKAIVESWRRRLELDNEPFRRLARALHWQEIINLNSTVVEAADDPVLRDFVDARYRLEIEAGQRALVVADAVSDALKRAPQIMTRYYRRRTAIGGRELLNAFNCQQVSESFFDYEKYKANYKGLLETEIAEGLSVETGKVRLPQIVYTAHTVAFYPPIEQFSEAERSTVALGFETADYRDEAEIVWVAAEIDSKLEASKELAEFWCDRLEMVALSCNFLRYRLWLITPEGFSPEASEVLRQRGAFGSSRRQIELLAKELDAGGVFGENSRSNEYEMIVPMGDDTEMIAAQTVEEIARRHHFAPKAINQIKTALVEACINASEHSHSPDRRIHQRFAVEDDKIVITISNRGIKMPASKAAAAGASIEPDAGRRGWGLKLMRTLMDEVNFEQSDDGTRISMVKYLREA